MSDYESLNHMQLDVLKEIGNIGAGNAATALASLLGQKIDMHVPNLRLLNFSDAADALGGAESLTVGVLVGLEKDVKGMVMFLLNKDFAHMILNVLLGQTYQSFDELDEMAMSAINEIGNILSGAYINSIAEMTGLNIVLTTPSVAIDMAGALMSVPIIQFGSVGDKIFFIEEEFEGDGKSVKSQMILFAEVDSLNLILNRLGLA